MAELTGHFNNVDDPDWGWDNENNLNNDDTSWTRTYNQPASSSRYMRVWNWQHRDSIKTGATINSILISIRGYVGTSATYTGTGFSWAWNMEDTSLSAYRKYSGAVNEGTQTTLTIPTSGTGNAPSWWKSGWTSAAFITAIKNGDKHRIYATNTSSDIETGFIEYLTMTVDFDNPPTKGGILLGSFA